MTNKGFIEIELPIKYDNYFFPVQSRIVGANDNSRCTAQVYPQ